MQIEVKISAAVHGGTDWMPNVRRLHLGSENAEQVDSIRFDLPDAWHGKIVRLHTRWKDGTRPTPVLIGDDGIVQVGRTFTGSTSGLWMLSAIDDAGYKAMTRPTPYDCYNVLRLDGDAETEVAQSQIEQFAALCMQYYTGALDAKDAATEQAEAAAESAGAAAENAETAEASNQAAAESASAAAESAAAAEASNQAATDQAEAAAESASSAAESAEAAEASNQAAVEQAAAAAKSASAAAESQAAIKGAEENCAARAAAAAESAAEAEASNQAAAEQAEAAAKSASSAAESAEAAEASNQAAAEQAEAAAKSASSAAKSAEAAEASNQAAAKQAAAAAESASAAAESQAAIKGAEENCAASAAAAAESANAAATSAETAAESAAQAEKIVLSIDTMLRHVVTSTSFPPAQVGTLTYNGSEQSPVWSNYDTTKLTIGGTTSATNAGTYTATFTPNDGYKWADGTTDEISVNWTIDKANGCLNVDSFLAIDSEEAQTITVTRSGTGTVSATSSDTSVATVTVSSTTLTIAPVSEGTATITVSVAADPNYTAPSNKTCTVTVAFPAPIYGVVWDGTSTTAWTRTDDAALFTDPVPYVSGATEYGSPFDDIQPWAGIKRVTDDVAGELVEIPKFWYKWTQSGSTLKLQISASELDGFYVSPAHADRCDGKGERDVVYVGRYHCDYDTHKSAIGGYPWNTTISDARTNIESLGTGIYQWDMAMRVTIQMLYLVEYADWDSQAQIGYGCVKDYCTDVGASDTMPYHTGTMQTSRTTYDVGVQYRYIEGLWDNLFDWLDGCYYGDGGLFIIKNPADFSDNANGTFGTLIGKPSGGYPTKMSVSTVSGFEWVIYPTAVGGSDTTYVPDYWNYWNGYKTNFLFVGGSETSQSRNYGLFYVSYDSGQSDQSGCRLMKLP